MGLEEGLKLGRERLQLGYFHALGARVVSSEIWFVADLLKLTVRWQARQLKSRQMSACLGYSGRGRGSQRCQRRKWWRKLWGDEKFEEAFIYLDNPG